MQQQTNSSGTGADALVPDEVRGWNWGAFLLNWIWGLGNGTYIALLMFIPLFWPVLPFVLGALGNKWAWQNRKWPSVEAFKREQRIWAIAGLIVYVLGFGFILSIVLLIGGIMKGNDAYQLSLQAVKQHPQVQEAFGEPIDPGFLVTGKVSIEGPSGQALISYSITGPKASGTVYVEASKDMGKWNFERMEVEVEPDKRRIILVAKEVDI